MFVMFFNVVFSMFVCYSAAFCQLCFTIKIGLDWIGQNISVSDIASPHTAVRHLGVQPQST